MLVFILKYLVLTLCLAYLNHVFSKKKAVAQDVKRHVLEKRLKLYAALHKLITRNSALIAPPALNEQYYWSLIDGMPFRIGDQKMEYVSYFGSYDKLSEYYLLLQGEHSGSVFLPKDVEETLQMVNDWYVNVMELLSAFKVLEDEDTSLTDEQRNEHLDLACQMFGIALQSDIEQMSHHLKHTLTARLQMPSLLNLFKVSVVNKVRLWFFKRNYEKFDLGKYSPCLLLVLNYIHVSVRYSRDEFDELPEDERTAELREFHASFIKHLPNDGNIASDSDRD